MEIGAAGQQMVLARIQQAAVFQQRLGLQDKVTGPADLSDWEGVVDRLVNTQHEVTVAMVGKYVDHADAYKSLTEAITHGGLRQRIKVNIVYYESEDFADGGPVCVILGDNIIETIINKSEKVKNLKNKAKDKDISAKEKKELSDEEKAVMALLKPVGEIDLSELKEKTGLSNKKWDKATKALSKKGLFQVEKTETGLIARLKG